MEGSEVELVFDEMDCTDEVLAILRLAGLPAKMESPGELALKPGDSQ